MTYAQLRQIAAFRSRAALDCGEQLVERTFEVRCGLAHTHPSLKRDDLEHALELGVSFLKRRQGADGTWKGFLLQPGAATSWLTAHIAFVVEAVPALDNACRRAALHLESTGPNDGGWGYNRHCGVDSDSTAQALLVLHRFDRSVPEFLVESLLRAQLPCGGFATYAPSNGRVNGWQCAHEDVTIIVIETLRRYGHVELAQPALNWLDTPSAEATFASYWWLGPQYGLWARARTGLHSPRLARAVAAAFADARSTPQIAQTLAASLALQVAHHPLEAEATLQLLRTQLSDGSWPCSPCLRATEPSEVKTGPTMRGQCYADQRRIFSTAHAVAAVQAVLHTVP